MLAVYGNVQIPRIFCHRCQRWALILKGVRQCCEDKTEVTITKRKRISQTYGLRKRPRKKDRERLLREFHDACAYCERTFNRFVHYHGKLDRTKLTRDHQVPWIYSQDNRGQNFLPACQFCNAWKSSFVFKTLEEVKIYVGQKWEEDYLHYTETMQEVS